MSQANTTPLFVKMPCYVTGRLVLDTDRERIKQKLARLLVEERGFGIGEIAPDREISFEFYGQRVITIADLVVQINRRSLMVLRGGPGSVVTRESGTIAAARLVEPSYIVPWAVQANLFEAALLDVRHKKAVAYGWESIPSRSQLLEMTAEWPPPALPGDRVTIERQILYSYDTHWRKDRPEVKGAVLCCQ